MTVKLAALVAVPPGVVTAILPVVVPAGTVAVIRALLTTLKVAALPPKVTAVAPVKPVPLTLTLVPTGPEVGAKLVTVGAAITMKLVALAPLPPGFVTAMVPLVAPLGTVAVIRVLLTTL
jgi:hypothetical protein